MCYLSGSLPLQNSLQPVIHPRVRVNQPLVHRIPSPQPSRTLFLLHVTGRGGSGEDRDGGTSCHHTWSSEKAVIRVRERSGDPSPTFPGIHVRHTKREQRGYICTETPEGSPWQPLPKNPLLTVATTGAREDSSGGGRLCGGSWHGFLFIPLMKEVLAQATRSLGA